MFFVRRLYLVVGLCLLLSCWHGLRAQVDVPFSLHFDAGLLYNPSTCGLSSEEAFLHTEGRTSPVKQEILLNYRNQMSNAFTSQSVKILNLAYQVRFFKERMSLGVHVFSNTLNRQAMQDIMAMFTYAYHWTIVSGSEGWPMHRLSFGLQAGYRFYGFKPDNILTGGMYDPSYVGGYNPSLRPVDELPEPRNLFDGNFGILYTGRFSERLILNAGFSMYHLFRPQTGWGDDIKAVPLRWLGHAQVLYSLSSVYGNSQLKPEIGVSAFYSYQSYDLSSQKPHTIGAGIEVRMHLEPWYLFSLGLDFRTERTFIPYFAFDVKGFELRLQMEFNASYSYNNMMGIGLSYRW